ncbi:hypothetical protein GGX14DRAFT_646035 [Mycena pura]|uniref:Uncharacterized protein n=1 Tax=Mycena pura TaxID=153505 RepID=A0AAD6V6Z2_9AGAR|nr:hypothetical protein GGX14DRAFT_646035 [Mycena pura]
MSCKTQETELRGRVGALREHEFPTYAFYYLSFAPFSSRSPPESFAYAFPAYRASCAGAGPRLSARPGRPSHDLRSSSALRFARILLSMLRGRTYNPPGTFETCDAGVAYPPGWYPTVGANGQTSFSTFAQFFTGVFTGGNGLPTPCTVGDTVTPTAPAFIPSFSNCVTQATISNGIAPALLTANAVGTAPPPGFSTNVAASGAASGSASASTPAGSESAGGSGSAGAGASNTATPTNKGTGGASAGAGSSSGAAPTGSSPARRGARVGHGSDGEFAAIALLSLVSGLVAIALLH